MVGLGRMGANMTLRLLRGGHEVIAYDHNPETAIALKSEGAVPATSIDDMIAKMERPRHVWIMVPSGTPVTETIEKLSALLDEGDCVIDGGNSHYIDSVTRAAALKEKGIHFLDAGVSGGIWGLANGYCMMVGGEQHIFNRVEPIISTLAPNDGYLYVGPWGSGHYVKMIHNGIEYGMLQAYAEGFEILDASAFDLDLPAIAQLWNHGSVVRSWLLELAVDALKKDPNLELIRGYVEDSGEGRWTVQEAIDRSVPAVVLTYALMARFRSRQEESFGAKLIAALRQEFGGHLVHPVEGATKKQIEPGG
jgi:6-phosphogluconate dehydrogenase